MAWHPRLVVRFGKGRSISSPTSSSGYVLLGFMGASLTCALSMGATHEPLLLLALAVPGFFLRDAWAWFASTEEERAAFRAEVERLKSQGWGPPPNQVLIGERWGWKAVAGLLAVLALSIALVAFVSEAFLVPMMFAAAFLAAVLFDRLRARTHKSAA